MDKHWQEASDVKLEEDAIFHINNSQWQCIRGRERQDINCWWWASQIAHQPSLHNLAKRIFGVNVWNFTWKDNISWCYCLGGKWENISELFLNYSSNPTKIVFKAILYGQGVTVRMIRAFKWQLMSEIQTRECKCLET